MKPMTNDEYADAVLREGQLPPPFRPTVTYVPEGDCIEFVVSDNDYHAERIDGLVTVYRDEQTGEIVGSLIKGVRRFVEKVLQRCPGFKIEIEDQRVKLEHIFLAQLWSEPRRREDMLVRTYRKLIEVAERTGATAQLAGSA
jgi:hypothetical protein